MRHSITLLAATVITAWGCGTAEPTPQSPPQPESHSVPPPAPSQGPQPTARIDVAHEEVRGEGLEKAQTSAEQTQVREEATQGYAKVPPPIAAKDQDQLNAIRAVETGNVPSGTTQAVTRDATFEVAQSRMLNTINYELGSSSTVFERAQSSAKESSAKGKAAPKGLNEAVSEAKAARARLQKDVLAVHGATEDSWPMVQDRAARDIKAFQFAVAKVNDLSAK